MEPREHAMKADGAEFLPLYEIPGYAPILALWSYMEWYRPRNIPFKAVLASYAQRAQSRAVPMTFVASVNTLPVGMVSLKMDDLWTRKDLNPWLASLYVMPEYRKRGIASGLIERLVAAAKELGLERLYLFLGQTEKSHLSEFYAKMGWDFFEEALDNDGKETEIFRYSLAGK